MTIIQIIKTIVKIATIVPVIVAGVKAIVEAYKAQNETDGIDDLLK